VVAPVSQPFYDSPAQIRGSAQLIPRAKIQGGSIAVLNFRLSTFGLATADLGKTLEMFAQGFFPDQGKLGDTSQIDSNDSSWTDSDNTSPEKSASLIVEHIVFNLPQNRREHKHRMLGITNRLRAAQ
jgi:hypothetical protein